MDGNSEEIRQQLEETKTHLTEKLGSLEQQVAETVQSTGAVVNATVENVQETVESVTGAVQDAVRSVGNVFDVPAHVQAHPWISVGGAALFGFLAARHFSQGSRTQNNLDPSLEAQIRGQARPEVVAAAVRAAYDSGRRANSPWRQLKMLAVGALAGLAQDVAARAGTEIWRQVAVRLGPAPGAGMAPPDPQAEQLQIHRADGLQPDNPWDSRRQQL